MMQTVAPRRVMTSLARRTGPARASVVVPRTPRIRVAPCRAAEFGQTGGRAADAARRAAASSGGDSAEQRRLQEFEALLERAVRVPPEQLPAFVEAEREALTTAFLAYVAGSSPAGRASLGGASGLPSSAPPAAAGPGSSRDSASLAELAARLTMLKERADWEASKRLLPSAAASLAAANLAAWRASQKGNGQAEALPEVAPGVSLEDVYRAGEREELKLQRTGRLSGAGSSGASTLDAFTSPGPGAAFAGQAAAAMERVRARLMGYGDDGGSEDSASGSSSGGSGGGGGASSCARRLLAALLTRCWSREERAQALSEACLPPGLLVDEATRLHLVTSPAALQAAIAAEVARGARGEAVAANDGPGAGSSSLDSNEAIPVVLPSGEAAADALTALAEDVADYDAAVYSRLSPLERFGAGPRWP